MQQMHVSYEAAANQKHLYCDPKIMYGKRPREKKNYVC